MATAPESLKTVVTYLEQTARPKLFVPMPVNLQVALMQQTEMPLHFYRYLQYRIGRDYHWVSRLRLNDAELGKILHDDATSIVSIRRRPPVVLFDFVADLGPWN